MRACLLFLLLTICLQLFAQSQVIDLESVLNTQSLSDSQRVERLNQLSRELIYVNAGKALQCANSALKLATETGNTRGIAYAYRNLSGIYSLDGSYSIAMHYVQNALDIFSQTKDSLGIANCYVSLGHTYRRLHNRENEIAYHKKAYEIFVRLRIGERMGVSAHNLGESYFNGGDIDKAESLTRLAIAINDSLGNKSVLTACYKVLGQIELSRGNHEAAEKHFLKCLDISMALGANSQKVATAEAILNLASIYNLRKDSATQLKYLVKAAKFCQAHQLPNHLQNTYNELILFFSNHNEQKKVQTYVAALKHVSDSINEKQLADRFELTNNIVRVHELSKKQASLEKINSLQEQDIKNRNTVLILVAVFVLLLVSLMLLLFKVNRKLNQQNQTVETQRRDLAKLNETKDRFFSIVAHDLRSPLSSLRSFSSLLIDHFDQLTKEEILLMSNELKTSVDNTLKMTDNLLTWARLQMNDVVPKKEPVYVHSLVHNIVDVYKAIAASKGIDLRYSHNELTPAIIGDSNQIEFILRNLVNNAIKFTGTNGVVALEICNKGSDTVSIIVTDNGVGMKAEVLRNLFHAGKKSSSTGTAGEGGTGLGLMLSYEFVRLNNGTIAVSSTEAVGTTFEVNFPLALQKQTII